MRIALTLPGGIAPGTFEAGAVCALLTWTQELNARKNGTIAIDVIAGASAGALTGLLAARVLLAGDDPIAVYRRAWVAGPSLRALRGTGPWAPLSLRRARTIAWTQIFAPSEDRATYRQETPVILDVALSCLRGFSREFAPGDGLASPGESQSTSSHLDWSTHELHHIPAGRQPEGDERDTWRAAIESVIASASHPLGFPAQEIDRERERPRYREQRVMNLPTENGKLALWYTDGGLLDNEPLGRCLDRVAKVDITDTPARLVILVRANTHAPPDAGDPAWSGRLRPRWTETLARAFGLLVTNAVERDLEKVQHVNARLASTRDLATKITAGLGDDDAAGGRLRDVLLSIESERRTVGEGGEQPLSADPRALAELVEDALLSASGLLGKRHVEVAVVTPDAAFSGPAAGHDLVGFIGRRGRDDHFAAGYWSMLARLPDGIQLRDGLGLGALIGEDAQHARAAAERRVRKPSARHAATARYPLSARMRVDLMRLAARTFKITAGDAVALRARRGRVGRRPGGRDQ